jgi:hypothetical protein
MLEFVAYALIGALLIGGLLYVTIAPEVEDSRNPKSQEPKQ